MKILVFAAKDVGLETTRFLLERFSGDEYRFIVAEPGARDLQELLRAFNYECELLNDSVVEGLAADGAGTYDWLLNLWCGHVFRQPTLDLAKRSLNIHPSPLPIGRGRDPVVWAIRNEEPAGVTLHAMDHTVDGGRVWYQEVVPYELPITGQQLYTRVVKRCVECFCAQWPTLRTSELPPQPQGLPERRARRRAELYSDQIIDADNDRAAREVLLRLLAHDFGEQYHAKVKLGGRMFGVRLNISEQS